MKQSTKYSKENRNEKIEDYIWRNTNDLLIFR